MQDGQNRQPVVRRPPIIIQDRRSKVHHCIKRGPAHSNYHYLKWVSGYSANGTTTRSQRPPRTLQERREGRRIDICPVLGQQEETSINYAPADGHSEEGSQGKRKAEDALPTYFFPARSNLVPGGTPGIAAVPIPGTSFCTFRRITS